MTAAAYDDRGLDDLGPDALLDALAEADRQVRAGERDKLRVAHQWAVLHPATADSGLSPFTGRRLRSYEADEAVGGDGCPGVAAFAAEPLGVTLGVSTVTAIQFLADAMDLHHRLPKTWALVDSLEVPAWKARQVARLTHSLPRVGARWVDEQIAPRLKRCGARILDRTVAQAIARFDPDRHAEKEARAAQTADVELFTPTASEFAGTSELLVRGDTQALTALHRQVCSGAAALGRAGDTRPLGVRKFETFRGLLGLASASLPVAEEVAQQPSRNPGARARDHADDAETTLYLHVDLADLVTYFNEGTTGVGRAEKLGPATIATLEEWLAHGHVTIRPVIRHDRDDPVAAHDPPEGIREQVILRDGTCRFPGCQVDARRCDLDHVVPYDPHGPPDQTRPSNLACLCRRHHRAKTARVWRYILQPNGACQWTGPGFAKVRTV